MQRAGLVFGLFFVAMVMGALLGIVGNVWIEFYLKYLGTGSWMLDLSSSLVALVLIGLCVFLTAAQLSPRAETADVKRAIKVERDFKVTIPGRFASQLDINPGDRVAVTVDQDRLVLEKKQ